MIKRMSTFLNTLHKKFLQIPSKEGDFHTASGNPLWDTGMHLASRVYLPSKADMWTSIRRDTFHECGSQPRNKFGSQLSGIRRQPSTIQETGGCILYQLKYKKALQSSNLKAMEARLHLCPKVQFICTIPSDCTIKKIGLPTTSYSIKLFLLESCEFNVTCSLITLGELPGNSLKIEHLEKKNLIWATHHDISTPHFPLITDGYLYLMFSLCVRESTLATEQMTASSLVHIPAVRVFGALRQKLVIFGTLPKEFAHFPEGLFCVSGLESPFQYFTGDTGRASQLISFQIPALAFSDHWTRTTSPKALRVIP